MHPLLLTNAGAEERLRALAEAIGARGDAGLVGAPQLAANARGAHELAPALAGADPAIVLAAAASGQLSSLLLFGNEPWAELDTGQARLIVATHAFCPMATRAWTSSCPWPTPMRARARSPTSKGRVQHQ